MKTYFLALLLVLAGSVIARAQGADNASKSDSLIKVMPIYSGRYTNTIYTLNGEPITNATLKALLWKYPESAVEMRKYRAQHRVVLALVPVTLAALIVGCVQASQQKDATGSAFSRAPVQFSIYLAGLGGMIVAGATNNHYGKAIEAYNRHFKQ